MGLGHFMNTDQMVEYATSKGVPYGRLAVLGSGLLLVLGGLSVVTGIYPIVGGAFVALFMLVVTLVMHDFWTINDPEERQNQMTQFLKNTVIFGAALVFVELGGAAWPYALNIRL
jgi:putative oxidoreductase